ncbi:uncharacterized protein LOC121111114 isoform X2 [Gallus gallus]|uniref:uncharacterized protein LOC121111114 isoform X2 n=1 Tax=Gallus gallus TaxID=9031 RepID=UPI001AEB1109|nr:uncharacterized protein LOC121111114 isoform X2 [Gallus gallus]
MSSCLWGKNTFLPCTWLCSMASAGCVLFAFLCLVPRAPTFPICTHDGGRESLANRRNKRGWGIRKGTSPITLHLTAFELRPAGWTLNETCFPFAFRISLVLLKQKRQELNVTITQMSAGKESILQAVGDVLSNNGIQEEKRGEILQLTRDAIKVIENYIWMLDWALKTTAAGLSKDLRAMWSSGCQRKSSPELSPSGTSPGQSLRVGKSAAPPKSLLSQ